LIFVPKAKLRWRVVLGWLVYPLAYMIFAVVRGSLVGRYPYPFLDAGTLGYLRVLSNAAMLLCGFLTVSLIVVAVSRSMATK